MTSWLRPPGDPAGGLVKQAEHYLVGGINLVIPGEMAACYEQRADARTHLRHSGTVRTRP